jgi:hypothetical protein
MDFLLMSNVNFDGVWKSLSYTYAAPKAAVLPQVSSGAVFKVTPGDTNVPANAADYVPAASLTGLNATGLGSERYSVPNGVVLATLPDLSSGTIPLPPSISTTTIPNPFQPDSSLDEDFPELLRHVP